MNRSKSSKIPEKNIICALQYSESESKEWVDYYVTDEKKFIEIGKRYKEEKWEEETWGNDVVIGSELELELKETVKPISKIKKPDMLDGSYIVFKSCLYHIGGSKRDEGEASKRVCKLDLKNMDLGWVPVAEMNNGRYNPYPVILDGKLYVVGGVTEEEEEEEEEEETPVLMEVLKSDGSEWENIPNPDLTVPPPPPEGDYVVPQNKNEYLRYVYSEVIVGAVEGKTGDGFIIVAFHTELNKFELYTYDAGANNNWKPYTKISSKDLKDIGLLCTHIQPTVVWGHVMLFLGQLHILYVMDLETGKLGTINLVQKSVIDGNMLGPSFLVMIEPGKFCVFWVGYSPRSASFSVLKGCVFTLIRTKRNTFSVTQRSPFFSLLPDLTICSLQALCLVDYIPDIEY